MQGFSTSLTTLAVVFGRSGTSMVCLRRRTRAARLILLLNQSDCYSTLQKQTSWCGRADNDWYASLLWKSETKWSVFCLLSLWEQPWSFQCYFSVLSEKACLSRLFLALTVSIWMFFLSLPDVIYIMHCVSAQPLPVTFKHVCLRCGQRAAFTGGVIVFPWLPGSKPETHAEKGNMLCYIHRCRSFLVLLLVAVVCQVWTCHFLQSKQFESEATTLFACWHIRGNIFPSHTRVLCCGPKKEETCKVHKELYSYHGWFKWQLDLF